MPRLLGFVIDCPNALTLATFYENVTGCRLMEGSDETSAGVVIGELGLTFQRVANYRPPNWPGGQQPKQFVSCRV